MDGPPSSKPALCRRGWDGEEDGISVVLTFVNTCRQERMLLQHHQHVRTHVITLYVRWMDPDFPIQLRTLYTTTKAGS